MGSGPEWIPLPRGHTNVIIINLEGGICYGEKKEQKREIKKVKA